MDEMWKASLLNAQHFAWNSVQESSRLTYQTGWRLWCEWAAQLGTDATMQKQPPCQWQQEDFPLSFQEACVLSFMSMASASKNLKPSTIATYMSGVRFMLKQLRVDTTFMDHSEIIRSSKAGMEVVYRLTHPVVEEATLPFTLDMIVFAQRFVYNTPTVLDRCIIIAMKMAYTALLRCSEYIDNGQKNPHHARAEHVICVFSTVNAEGVEERKHVPSYDAHLHSEENFIGILLDVASAKNDINGVGNQFWWQRQSIDTPVTDKRPYDIALDMFRWAVYARPLQGHQFLSSSQHGGVELKYSTFNKATKNVATRCNLNAKQYSSHSYRIGGASALKTEGVQPYMIQLMGPWKSLAFMDYIRLSCKAYSHTLAHLSDCSLFTLNDARILSDRSLVAGC